MSIVRHADGASRAEEPARRRGPRVRVARRIESAQECARPGTVIDEDVRRCMKGM